MLRLAIVLSLILVPSAAAVDSTVAALERFGASEAAVSERLAATVAGSSAAIVLDCGVELSGYREWTFSERRTVLNAYYATRLAPYARAIARPLERLHERVSARGRDDVLVRLVEADELARGALADGRLRADRFCGSLREWTAAGRPRTGPPMFDAARRVGAGIAPIPPSSRALARRARSLRRRGLSTGLAGRIESGSLLRYSRMLRDDAVVRSLVEQRG